jgi:heat shock protein HslJ
VSAAPSTAGKEQPLAGVPLENTYWKLIRLGDTTVKAAKGQQEPHLILHPADKRVSGSTGCNRLIGSYTKEGDQLAFAQMAGTMMACVSGMEYEQAFREALGRVTRWRVDGEALSLSDASGRVLAEFESRYMR